MIDEVGVLLLVALVHLHDGVAQVRVPARHRLIVHVHVEQLLLFAENLLRGTCQTTYYYHATHKNRCAKQLVRNWS